MTPRYPDPKTAATQPRWTREQIRRARLTPLRPLLQARNHTLLEHEAGNFEPAQYPGLLIKENYWRWPDRDMSGNTIDFFTQVLRTTFHAAMVAITEANTPPKAS
jgi:hypothetical protein